VAASLVLANCAPFMTARANLMAVSRFFCAHCPSAMYWVMSVHGAVST
jgi:hypothetical protein